MFRLAGQILAIVAVVASAINAQCALSCSILGAMRNVGQQAPIVRSHSGSHACCPDRTAPARRERTQQDQRCPAVITGEIVAANPTQYLDAAQLFVGLTSVPLDRDLPVLHYDPPVILDSSGIPDIPAFAILRI